MRLAALARMLGLEMEQDFWTLPGESAETAPEARTADLPAQSSPRSAPLAISAPAPALIGEPDDSHHAAVRRALYQRAVGGETWEDKLDRFGGVQRLRKDLPPDPASAEKWLKTYDPDTWVQTEKHDVRVIVARLGPDVPAARVIETEVARVIDESTSTG